jgi:hypothetical protein
VPGQLLRALLLTLLFLVVQGGAIAHDIEHLRDKASGAKPVCEQCLAYATLDSPAPIPSLPAVPAAGDVLAVASSGIAAVHRAGIVYRSRAPPAARLQEAAFAALE